MNSVVKFVVFFILSLLKQSGTTVVDEKGNMVRVCMTVNQEQLENILMDTLKKTSCIDLCAWV